MVMNYLKKALLIVSIAASAPTASAMFSYASSSPAFSALGEPAKKVLGSTMREAGKVLAFALATSGVVTFAQNIITAHVCPEHFAHYECEHACGHATGSETAYRAMYAATKKAPIKTSIMMSLRTTHRDALLALPLALVAFYGKKNYSPFDLAKLSLLSLPILGVSALVSGIYHYRNPLSKNIIEHYKHIRAYTNEPSSILEKEKEIDKQEPSSTQENAPLHVTQASIENLEKKIRLANTFNQIHKTVFCIGACISLGAATALHIKNIYDTLS